jgi:hypothetical protein
MLLVLSFEASHGLYQSIDNTFVQLFIPAGGSLIAVSKAHSSFE